MTPQRHVPAGGAEEPAGRRVRPGSINLIWDANTEADLGGYLVLRGEAPGDTLQPLTPEPIKETRYQDRDRQARRHLRLRDRRRRSRDAAQPQRAVEPRAGNRQMKKFYRIDYNGTPRHVIEAAEAGPWRLLEGELFGTLRGGRRGRARRAPRCSRR